MNEAKQAVVSGNGQPIRFVYQFDNDPVPNRTFELIVTTRSAPLQSRIPSADIPMIDNANERDDLTLITARTMRNWVDVMRALIFNKPMEGQRVAGIKTIRPDDDPAIAGIPPSDGDAYCTVWNMTNYYNPGLSVTVHSWDDGTHAYNTAFSHIRAIELFNANASKFGLQVVGDVTNSPKQTATPPPQARPNAQNLGTSDNPIGSTTPPQNTQQQAPEKPQPKSPFIRTTRAGMAQNLLSIQTGKKGAENFNTQAILITIPYDYKDLPQVETGKILAYELDGAISIGRFENTQTNEVSLYVDIPVKGGSAIRFYDRGGEHNYDYASLAQHLGYNDAATLRLAHGNTHFINAKYVTVKMYINPNNGKRYTNYHGFYAGHDSEVVGTESIPPPQTYTPPQQNVDDIPF